MLSIMNLEYVYQKGATRPFKKLKKRNKAFL